MQRIPYRYLGIALLLATIARAEDPAKLSPVDADFFETKVRPVLVERCFGCHGADKQKGGLRLDSPKAMRTGGDSGPAVVAGKLDESLLIDAIRYGGDIQMPPKGKMPEIEIATLTDWVKRGAPWPESKAVEASASTPSSSIRDEDHAFWAFQPVKNVSPPAILQTTWPNDDLDRFILAKLEDQGLTPAAPADKRTLIRRASFDLIGLPPTPAEVEAFLNDQAPEAFARVIDRLLASPHYGERWGRHWLDVARYGEDQAHTFEAKVYPNGYRYRDWLIDALNQDMPYDQFVIAQIAADLTGDPKNKERLAALGFFTLGPVYYGDPKKFDQLDDRIDTLSRGFLGLTVACARCHDHKFDPIPTSDYYSLAGVFASSEYQEEPVCPADQVEAYNKAQAEIKTKTAEIDTLLKAESKKVVEGQVDQLNAYLVAAWSSHTQPAKNLDEVAKARSLDVGVLRRWVKAFNDLMKKPADSAQLSAWLNRFETENPQAVADEFQNWVKALLIRKAIPDGAKLEAMETALIDELFGAKGLLAIPKLMAEATLPALVKSKLTELRKEVEVKKKSAPVMYPVVHALKDSEKPTDLKVLIRGNPETPGPVVSRHALSILGGAAPFTQGSGRLELAKSIASKENPLTARVMVNRVWQWHFGRGLVATPSNFGHLGERPSHPELLDHLVTRFIDGGWSLKRLHRILILSATYQQSNETTPQAEQLDPENRLLSRMSRRRLEVEAWRDAMLAVSGRLDPSLGGPSQKLEASENRRRTVYAKISRHDLSPLLRSFDFPDPNITSAERSRTTVPLQGLTVLNSDFLIENAKGLVALLEKEEGDEPRIRRSYELLFGRPATSQEVAIGLAYLHTADQADAPATGLSRWHRYAQALLSTNEFAFVD